MRDYLSHLLQDEYRVHEVCDGLQAIEAARQLQPALVLTDVMMPGMDGFGVLRAIRSDPSLNMTPVILVSARAGEESRVEGLEAGADDYLVKPFTARELLARVSGHVKMALLRKESLEAQRYLAAIVESSDDCHFEHRSERNHHELQRGRRTIIRIQRRRNDRTAHHAGYPSGIA